MGVESQDKACSPDPLCYAPSVTSCLPLVGADPDKCSNEAACAFGSGKAGNCSCLVTLTSLPTVSQRGC